MILPSHIVLVKHLNLYAGRTTVLQMKCSGQAPEIDYFGQCLYFYNVIRKSTQQDFNFIFELYMHPEVNMFLLYEQMPAANFRDIFADLLAREVSYVFEQEGQRTGMFKLVPMMHRNSHIAYLGGLAIDPAASGKGNGLIMLNEIKRFATEKGFLRVELSVACTNERAIHLYEKAGFTKEGVLRNFTYLKSEDKFLDEVVMSWLSD